MSEPGIGPLTIVPESTPNPRSVRFSVNRELTAGAGQDFRDAAAARDSPLARALFALPGVAGVFVGERFVTVTADADWGSLEPQVIGVLARELSSIRPAAAEQPTAAPGAAQPGGEADVQAGILRVLEEEIRPALAMDGGDAVFVGFKDGVVRLHLRGACHGCPAATITLKWGIEQRLRRQFPQVAAVEAV
jgi:Fe-S cluster biogenesis protein NfuA